MDKESIRNTIIIMTIMTIAIVILFIIGSKSEKRKNTYCDDTRCYIIYDEPIGPEYQPEIEVETDEDGNVDVIINGE